MKRSTFVTPCLLWAAIVLLNSDATGGVVINEILYHAPDDLDLEYVELFNTGPDQANLSGWTLSDGVTFTFPEDTVLPSGDHLVIAKDAGLVKEFYGVDVVGEFKKSLGNSSDTVVLADRSGQQVESVSYHDRDPWPASADGYSASLERICPTGSADNPANWAPSSLSGDYDKLPAGSPGQRNSVLASVVPPRINAVTWDPQQPQPETQLAVTVQAQHPDRLEEVAIHYRYVAPGRIGEEKTQPMRLQSSGQFTAVIPTGPETNRLLRFHIVATANDGGVARLPALNDLRPEYTAYVSDDIATDAIPVVQFFHVDQAPFETGEQYRAVQEQPRRGPGFGPGGPRNLSPEDRLRFETEMRLRSLDLSALWAKLTLSEQAEGDTERIIRLTDAFRSANKTLEDLRGELRESPSVADFAKMLPDKIKSLRDTLREETSAVLSKDQLAAIESLNLDRRGRPNFGRDANSMLRRLFNVEESWLRSALQPDLDQEKIATLSQIHRDFITKRDHIVADQDFPEMTVLFEQVRSLNQELDTKVAKVVGPAAGGRPAPPGRQFGGRGGPGRRGRPPWERTIPAVRLLPQGPAAFVYTNPESGDSEVYDFINITQRKSGWKVRFHKDRPFLGMTTVNYVYEPNEATILNESLAFELYRLAGNKSLESGYMRVVINGKPAGYHLYFEQLNSNFFRRNGIDDRGDLYKLIWMGNAEVSDRIPPAKRPRRQDIAGRHEKKSNRHAGYEDLIGLIEKLEREESDETMWQIIEQHFDVDQVINYFAVNSLISHWDGFFNNYFAYYDRRGTGKWTMYPWDQDSTWSQRGGRPEELYQMPLYFGAEGATPTGIDATAARRQRGERGGRGRFGRGGPPGFGRGFGAGGFSWWRDGGDFSRPLLANPEFYERFEKRLWELTETVFCEEVFGPKFDELRAVLEPEVRLRARMRKDDETAAVNELNQIVRALHEHLVARRAFVRREIRGETKYKPPTGDN